MADTEACIKRNTKKIECRNYLQQIGKRLSIYVNPAELYKYKDVIVKIIMFSGDDVTEKGMKDSIFTYKFDAGKNTETYTKPKNCQNILPPDADTEKVGESLTTYFNDMVEWFCDVSSWFSGSVVLKVSITGSNIKCRDNLCEAVFKFEDTDLIEFGMKF